jgi:hypothetical protein
MRVETMEPKFCTGGDPLLRLRVKSERKCSKEKGNKNGNYADKQNIPPNSILA